MQETMEKFAYTRRKFFVRAAAVAAVTCGFASSIMHPRFALAETSAEVREQANQVLAQLQELQDDLDIKSNNYQEALAEEEAARALMEDAQRRIDEAQAKIDKLKTRLATRVRGQYKQGDTGILDVLFGSTSFSAFVNNVQILNQMNENDANTVEETKALKAEIEVEKAEYERQEAIAEEKRKEAEAIMEEAQAVVDEIQAIYNALDAKANELLRQEIEAERQRRAAEEAARAAAAAAAAQQTGGNSGGDSSGDDGGSTSGAGADVGYDAGHNSRNVQRARQWVGVGRYVWCACSPDGAFDCSGLVAYAVTGVYSRIGTTWTFWNNNYGLFPDVSGYPQPGDICVVHTASKQHCGIYTGGSTMVHAADYDVGVVEGWFDRSVYKIVRYMGNG